MQLVKGDESSDIGNRTDMELEKLLKRRHEILGDIGGDIFKRADHTSADSVLGTALERYVVDNFEWKVKFWHKPWLGSSSDRRRYVASLKRSTQHDVVLVRTRHSRIATLGRERSESYVDGGMEGLVLVPVVQRLEEREWVKIGFIPSVIRLFCADEPSWGPPDPREPSPFRIRILRPIGDDRERRRRGKKMLAAASDNELNDEIVQGAPVVVEDVSNDWTPASSGDRAARHHVDKLAGLFIELTIKELRIGLEKPHHGYLQGVEVSLRPPEFRPAAIKRMHHGA